MVLLVQKDSLKFRVQTLNFKDYKKLNYSGQNLVLDLMAIGINVVLTAREKDETVQKMDKNGQQVSVSTGKKVHDSFKGIDYNVKTILHMYQDSETGQICAEVVKDRTKVHKAGDIIEDPTLLDWQTIIDRNSDRKEFVLKNDLDKAVETEQKMYEKEAMELHNSLKGNTITPDTSNNEKTSNIEEMKTDIRAKVNALPPVKKKEMKEKLERAGLPTVFKNVTDAAVLQKVLDMFK
mgnify:CR=1 FL=1